MKRDFFILRNGEFLLTRTGRAKRFKNTKNAVNYLLKGGVEQGEIKKKFLIVSYLQLHQALTLVQAQNRR